MRCSKYCGKRVPDQNNQEINARTTRRSTVWGVLENHWKGELLDKVEKVLGLCRTMTWKGKNPVVKLVKGVYPTGVSLAKSVMDTLENLIIRIPGIDKWAVDIPCY